MCEKTGLLYCCIVTQFLFICLGEMEPAKECCILQSHTQVIVSPKYRALPKASQSLMSVSSRHESVGNSETHGETSDDDAHNRSNVMLPSVNRLIAGFRSILFGSETDTLTGDIAESLTYKAETWNIKMKLFCRILALEDFTVAKSMNNFTGSSEKQQMLDADKGCSSELSLDETLPCSDLPVDSIDLSQQPTNVYISIFTILSQLPAGSLDSIPDTFLATLSCLRSPSEQLAASRIQHVKFIHSGSEDVKENDSHAHERMIVVRVMVTDFNNESHVSRCRFVQPIPQKHILVSSLLRRQMNISITGKVALAPLCMSLDRHPSKMNVYPLFSSVSCTLFVEYYFNWYICVIVIS